MTGDRRSVKFTDICVSVSRRGRRRAGRLWAPVFAALLAVMVFTAGCSGTNPGNQPYEPDTPAPAAHEGTFVSQHGTMQFNGDGEHVTIRFDSELAELAGLPEGEHEAAYVFLSGDLPPNGSVPVRYDTAHEMKLTVGEESVVIEMGIASEDGKSAQSGVNTVTPERIPMLFHGDGYLSVVFVKE